MHTIIKNYTGHENPIVDANGLLEILPHRYPFLFIDKVIYLDDKETIAIKNISFGEPHFQGHFPDMPIFPGVLQIESMAQAEGILVLQYFNPSKDYNTYLLSVEKCRFRRKIVPGDTMIMHVKLFSTIKMGIAKVSGTIYVQGEVACEAILCAAIVKKTN